MKNVKEFCESKGLGDNPILHGDKTSYLLSDLLHEFTHNVLDEAAERAKAEFLNLPGGTWNVIVSKQSILDIKNEL